MKKLIFLSLLMACVGVRADNQSDMMPELDIAADQQDDAEQEELMESVYEQTEVKTDSPLVSWIKYHGTKLYARYIIIKMYLSGKMRELAYWVQRKKQANMAQRNLA